MIFVMGGFVAGKRS